MLQRAIILQCSKNNLPLSGNLWPNMLQGSTRYVPPYHHLPWCFLPDHWAAHEGGPFFPEP
jgi:hypothetical protein